MVTCAYSFKGENISRDKIRAYVNLIDKYYDVKKDLKHKVKMIKTSRFYSPSAHFFATQTQMTPWFQRSPGYIRRSFK